MQMLAPMKAREMARSRTASISSSTGPANVDGTHNKKTAEQRSDGGPAIEDKPDESRREDQDRPKSKLCGMCELQQGKYKCPRCGLPFCCVACGKTHRENHPPDPTPEPEAPNATAPADASIGARDPSNPFGILDDSDQLRYLFRRYPLLQQQLLAISAQTEPPPGTQPSSLKEAILAKASYAGKPKKEQWNHDVGVRKGKEALRKARRAAGDDGEGVREYTELILHLTSREQGRNDVAGGGVVHREKTSQQDVELIKRLLQEESG